MKESLAILAVWLSCTNSGWSDAVVVRNHTGRVVAVWTREDGATGYKKVADDLWDKQSVRIHVGRMPFFVAISPRRGSYSYVGPFDRGLYRSDRREAEIVLNAKSVSETRIRLVDVWDPRRRRMARREVPYVVSREIAYAEMRGLLLGGADLTSASYSGSEAAARRYASDAARQLDVPAAGEVPPAP